MIHRRRRRVMLLGTAFVLGALVAFVPAGFAATDPCQPKTTPSGDVSITVWQPSSQASAADAHQCTPVSGATLSGSWNVRIDALSLTTSLSTFSVSILPSDPSIPPLPASATTSRTYSGILLSKISDTIEIPWNTSSLTPYNGVYQVTASATSLLSTVTATVSHLLINNPPATPPAPTVRLDGTTPVVTWAANGEPDLTGYRVLRSDGAAAFSLAGTVTTNSFRDGTAPQAKNLSYEIQAVRRSPADANGIVSAASAPSGAVTVAPPPVQPPPPPPAKVTVKAAPARVPVSAQQAASTNSTFAPTLPFTQALPQPSPVDTPTGTVTLSLPAGGASTTTLRQKATYLTIAVAILLISFLLFKKARTMIKSPPKHLL